MLCHTSAVSEGPSNINIRLGQETGYGTEINNFNGLDKFCVDDPSDSFNIGKLSIKTNGNYILTAGRDTNEVFVKCQICVIGENLEEG